MEDIIPVQCAWNLAYHSASMRVGAGISSWFHIQSGVKQECAILARLSESAMKRHTHIMAGTSEDVMVRMNKNVLIWFSTSNE